MDIRKQDVLTKEWVIEVRGHIFPLSMIAKMINTIMLFVLVALAYNVGQNDATQFVALSGYLSEKGIYDLNTNTWTKCYPTADGTKVVFECNKQNQTFIVNRTEGLI